MNRNILVVENEKRMARLLKARLKASGFAVAHASNGEEGLWRAMTEVPGAVIVNARLPFISGWELCGALKYNPATRHIPVIVLAARTNPAEDRARAFLTGCDALIEASDHSGCVAMVHRFCNLL